MEGLEELQEALKKYPEQWQQIAGRALGPGLAVLEREAKSRAPIGVTGKSASTIGSTIVREPGSQIVGKVGSGVDYGPYSLEYGRGPGKMPPVDKIEEWARFRGMPGAGFVIARAIGARGVKAPRVFSKTLAAKKAEVLKLFERGIADALKRLFR